jgi:hypothetical protein
LTIDGLLGFDEVRITQAKENVHRVRPEIFGPVYFPEQVI